MKLFLILYAAGKIGGIAGPLPYDLAECQKRAAALNNDFAQAVARGATDEGVQIPEKDMKVLRTMRAACEYRATRPTLSKEV